MISYHTIFIAVFVLAIQISSSEIIYFKNQTEITCLSDLQDPVFIDPPIEQTEKVLNDNDVGIWKDDDWIVRNAGTLDVNAVTDRRWQEFEVIQRKQLHFMLTTSISFSVYNSENLTLFLTKNRKSRRFELRGSGNNTWNHYTLIKKNGRIFIVQNGNVINQTNTDFDQVIVKNANKTYWRRHNYLVRSSTSETVEKPSVLRMPTKEKSCLMLYSFLCENCVLRVVILNGEDKRTVNITQNEKETVLKIWQTVIIDFDDDVSDEILLKFYRGTKIKNRTDDTYWGIDVRFCPDNVKNLGIYKTSLPETNYNYICRSLNTKEIPKEAVLCSEPGKLGRYCNITCESVLALKYCEGHQICKNSVCNCSWGYEGSRCQYSCKKGTWGQNCQQKCPQDCITCDKISGQCDEYTAGISIVIILIIVLLIVGVVVLVLLVGIGCYKYKSRRQTREDSKEMTSQVALTQEQDRPESPI